MDEPEEVKERQKRICTQCKRVLPKQFPKKFMHFYKDGRQACCVCYNANHKKVYEHLELYEGLLEGRSREVRKFIGLMVEQKLDAVGHEGKDAGV